MQHRGAIVAIFDSMYQSEEKLAYVAHLQWLRFLVNSCLKCSISHKLCDNVEFIFFRIVYDLEELKNVLMVLKVNEWLKRKYHLLENSDFIVDKVVCFFLLKIKFSALFFLINYFHSIFLAICFTNTAVNFWKSAPK
jgi:hypothetical protein